MQYTVNYSGTRFLTRHYAAFTRCAVIGRRIYRIKIFVKIIKEMQEIKSNKEGNKPNNCKDGGKGKKARVTYVTNCS